MLPAAVFLQLILEAHEMTTFGTDVYVTFHAVFADFLFFERIISASGTI